MKKLSVFSLCIVIILLGPGSSLTAYATPATPTFTVNSTADIVGYPGNTSCETVPGNGICTLRAAIMAANHLPVGGATIKIPPGTYTISIPPSNADDEASGDFNLTKNMSLVGDGNLFTTLDGNGLDRVFTIAASTVVSISGVTIESGNARVSPASHLGGGVYNKGTLTLSDDIITANSADQGGGIYTTGSMTLNATLVNANNTASQIENSGGGIMMLNNADVTINASSIVANTIPGMFGSVGAGIYCVSAKLSITNTTIKANSMSGSTGGSKGGGLYSSECTVTIQGSTISGNSTTEEGGGIVNSGSLASLLMVNSTVYGNFASAAGGGIVNDGGTANLYSVTVAGNKENIPHQGAGIYIRGGPVYLANTIIANNFYTISTFPYLIFDDCYGSVISQDYNLMTVTNGCSFSPYPGDRLNVPSYLGLLGNYGGLTQTVILEPGSPAISAGSPSGCTDGLGGVLTTDQRGFARQVYRAGQMRCDIGAYQTQLPLFLPILVK
jgi:CSLREA domain-containing protein